MKHTKRHQQNPYRTASYPSIEYTRYRTGKKPAYQLLDPAPRRNICTSAETEERLYLLFSEIDALILDNMPDALCIKPVNLIRHEYQKQTGITLNQQDIITAYHRFTEAEHGERP